MFTSMPYQTDITSILHIGSVQFHLFILTESYKNNNSNSKPAISSQAVPYSKYTAMVCMRLIVFVNFIPLSSVAALTQVILTGCWSMLPHEQQLEELKRGHRVCA